MLVGLLNAGHTRPKAVLYRHSDYVMAMAVAGPPTRPLLASAGLRAEVFLWDIAAVSNGSSQVFSLLCQHGMQMQPLLSRCLGLADLACWLLERSYRQAPCWMHAFGR